MFGLVLFTILTLAQPTAPAAGSFAATISTQGGTVLLPGVLVLVRSASGEQIAQEVSDGDGHVTVSGLAPGVYRLNATLDGFDPVDRSVTIAAGAPAVALTIDMTISAVAEHVDVVASPTVAETTGTLGSSETVSNTQTQWIAPGGGVQAALRLTAAVIGTPSGDSINGGRPHQSGFQIGAATLVDPVNNLARAWLPSDGLDSVTVLPSPYEPEFGRFSSGVVSVQTRRAQDQWRFAVNNTIPAFRTKRFTIANIEGIGQVKPSLEMGGPLVKGRVFLEQTAQFNWFCTDVPSRPEDELKTTQWFGAMTRLDANMSPHNSMSITGGFDNADAFHATLGTFTPPSATANLSDNLGYVIITERSLVSSATFLETTVQVHQYDSRASGQNTLPMVLLPETTLGDFYNRQHRESSTVQLVEAASTSRNGIGGLHLIKTGVDVMANIYDGQSISAPVIIRRSNQTLARRLDYAAPTTQDVHSVDIAVFAQDRLQPSKRWYVEFGARLDRDGVSDEVGLSPRTGAAVLLNPSGTAVLRAGYGLFYERTPSAAGAFQAFEAATDSRYADDGVTLIGPPLLVAHVADDLRPAHSTMWDVSYDHRLSPRWAIHAGILDRHGDGELILDPERDAAGERLVLSSGGRSRFLQEEVGVHLTRGQRMDVNATYIHASAREDLNGFLNFYDTLLSPIVGRNEYAAAAADVPHRLFARGQVMPTARWSVVGTFDWRTGLPYSVVNAYLDFVGPRNEQRFPTYMRTEIGVDRKVTIGHVHPWIGGRAANALAAFLPTDVQNNIGSPAYGQFYNSEYRQFRIHVRFER